MMTDRADKNNVLVGDHNGSDGNGDGGAENGGEGPLGARGYRSCFPTMAQTAPQQINVGDLDINQLADVRRQLEEVSCAKHACCRRGSDLCPGDPRN